MSYQFEDESALEELLNQQLDRRKSQSQGRTSAVQSSAASRPGTAGLRPTKPASSQFRPSTATSLGSSSRATAGRPLADVSAGGPASLALESTGPRSKLTAWLEGSTSAAGGVSTPRDRPSANKEAAPADDNDDDEDKDDDGALDNYGQSSLNRPLGSAPRVQLAPGQAGAGDDLSGLLTAERLQEMSRQRLIQLVLERVAPRLASLAQAANKQSAEELERLARELHAERARVQMAELRQEELIRLEQQKATQLSSQLESRLQLSERELAKLMDSQREHLERLDEQHKRNLATLCESHEKRLRDERQRFEETLKARDDMHRLEMESRLSVSCNLTKLDAHQDEWRERLAATINQLEAHYKSVASLLDRQAAQVRGTNSELAAKSRELCDQYDKLDECNGQLVQIAKQVNELLPELVESQRQGATLQESTRRVLGTLDEKLALLGAREQSLEVARDKIEQTRAKLDEDRLAQALDAARVQTREEQVERAARELQQRERALAAERQAQLELASQAQVKRANLDERAADLKEQNYTLHLLRKRLTHQREELLRAQVVLADERKVAAGEQARVAAETKRLELLRARAQRELDQLARLQKSLVCSLCMGRLFGGYGGGGGHSANNIGGLELIGRAEGHTIARYEPQAPLAPQTMDNDDSHNNRAEKHDDHMGAPYDEGQIFGRLSRDKEEAGGRLARRLAGGGGGGCGHDAVAASVVEQKTMANVESARAPLAALALVQSHNGNDLDLELRRTELESGRLVAESKYIEQLLLAS